MCVYNLYGHVLYIGLSRSAVHVRERKKKWKNDKNMLFFRYQSAGAKLGTVTKLQPYHHVYMGSLSKTYIQACPVQPYTFVNELKCEIN